VITAIGLIAAILTTTSFIPQLSKIVRTRSAEGISLWMYGGFTLGIAMWIAYGIFRRDAVIIGANVITVLLTIPILWIAYHEQRDARRR